MSQVKKCICVKKMYVHMSAFRDVHAVSKFSECICTYLKMKSVYAYGTHMSEFSGGTCVYLRIKNGHAYV